MTYRALLPLAFIFATAACGGYSGDRPLPPRTPADPPAAAATPAARAAARPTAMKTAGKGAGNTELRAKASLWYERYDLGATVFKLGDSAKKSMSGDDGPNYRRDGYDPGLGAYQRRLVALRQEQKRLLQENVRLRETLRLDVSLAAQLREMQSWLAQLSAGQAELTAQTYVVTEAHHALLAQLKRASPVQLEQP